MRVQDGSATGVTYLHGDHLGSVSLATTSNGTIASLQFFDPWGKVKSGGIGQTTLNYTGQRLDGTGLLYYNARMYDPGLGKFISADSIVPGKASGKGGKPANIGQDEKQELKALTVDFHEVSFVIGLNKENIFTQEKGFWFQLKQADKKEAKNSWGPSNSQALNRYSYVLNSPLAYVDPTGHETYYVYTYNSWGTVVERRERGDFFGIPWDYHSGWMVLFSRETTKTIIDIMTGTGIGGSFAGFLGGLKGLPTNTLGGLALAIGLVGQVIAKRYDEGYSLGFWIDPVILDLPFGFYWR